MRSFARLFAALDEATGTEARVSAVVDYLSRAEPPDAAWAVSFLNGNRPRKVVPVRRLATWAMELADVPPWMFEECYSAVEDLAETIALLLPAADGQADIPLHEWIETRIPALANLDQSSQRDAIARAWRELDGTERLVFNKLVTGELRLGIPQRLVVRALSHATGIPATIIAHRLTGTWKPTGDAFERLGTAPAADSDVSQPYPFVLAHPLEDDPESSGDPGDWQVELQWDGIRAQVIRRDGQVFIWSSGAELLTSRFPELVDAATALPDGTVIDGELLAWQHDRPLPVALLQRRIGRHRLTREIMANVPVVFVAHDLLEFGGADIRDRPLPARRELLEQLLASIPASSTSSTPGDLFGGGPGVDSSRPGIILSTLLPNASWDAVRNSRAIARDAGAEGLMLRRRDSAYDVGRQRGAWWTWKAAPHSIDAVMVYAQAGRGSRASLLAHYTVAVWNGDELVPFAKTSSGLTDEEARKIDAWIRRNTIEKFGPVRAVKAEQVFELGFEGIQPSSRHKSGVAVRLPRILRWRTDKRASDAGTLGMLRSLIE